MISRIFSRPFTRIVVGVAVIALAQLRPSAQETSQMNQPAADGEARLVVHEWGTFTSIAGEDGTAVEWRPLNGSSDLPGFVHTMSETDRASGLRHASACNKCDLSALVRMETPVLYFYTDRETDVSVRVDFPKGRITEWYPQARFVNGGIDWGRFKVLPDALVDLPREEAESHYYPAREVDAAPVRVCGQRGTEHERFLFYRGVGNFDLPLSVALKDDDRIVVKNFGREEIGTVVLFENRQGKIGYRIRSLLKRKFRFNRPTAGQTIDSLERDLENILITHGLYEKEARAMLKTWRDSWFEEGLRIFYIVPRGTTDSILPVTIDPTPAELVRVLVGRTEVITPEMEHAVQQQVAKLGSGSPDVRKAAMTALKKRGRFSEPILKRIAAHSGSAGIKARIERLTESGDLAPLW
ncbi:MAG TPA: hypothetical protein VJH03_11995 [Blastocatellia bacterium]|nr:hypothetical protein [Blastocatellia bacterium]